MVKKIAISLIIIFLAGYGCSAQVKKEEMELRVKSLAGHNLFLLVTTFPEIEKSFNEKEKTYSREKLREFEDKLAEVKAYSIVADGLVGNELLQTITSRFQDIFAHLDKSHTTKELSKDEIEEVVEIMSMMNEFIDIIYQTYYQKDDHYGGSAELNMKDFSKVEAFQKKITDYYHQMSQKQ